jgi:Clp protease
MQPFLDIRGRTLGIGGSLSTEVAMDTLLRLQNAGDSKRPITVYCGIGSWEQQPLSTMEALQLSQLMRCLVSPIQTFALGLLRGGEALVLASGDKGRRHMLQSAMITFGEQEVDGIGLKPTGFGLNSPTTCRKHELKTLMVAQVQRALRDLEITPAIWNSETILVAKSAIEAGFADLIVPVRERFCYETKTPSILQQPPHEASL